MGNPELIMTLNIVTPLPSTLRKFICMPLSLQPHPLYLLPFVTVYRGRGFPARSMQHESPCCCHSNTCLPWQLLSTRWTSIILTHCILLFKIRLCILLFKIRLCILQWDFKFFCGVWKPNSKYRYKRLAHCLQCLHCFDCLHCLYLSYCSNCFTLLEK